MNNTSENKDVEKKKPKIVQVTNNPVKKERYSTTKNDKPVVTVISMGD